MRDVLTVLPQDVQREGKSFLKLVEGLTEEEQKQVAALLDGVAFGYQLKSEQKTPSHGEPVLAATV